MRIDIIFSDLDGTLLLGTRDCPRDGGRPWPGRRSGDFLRARHRAFFNAIPRAVQELPFCRYAIVMNGAVVWDRAEGGPSAGRSCPRSWPFG